MSTHYVPRVQVSFAAVVESMNDAVDPNEGNIRLVVSDKPPQNGQWPKIRDAELSDWSPDKANKEVFAALEFDVDGVSVVYGGEYTEDEIINLVWLTFDKDGLLNGAATYGPNIVEEYLGDILGELVSEHDDEYFEIQDERNGAEDEDEGEPSEEEVDARAAVIGRMTDAELENVSDEEFNYLVRQELVRRQESLANTKPKIKTRSLVEAIQWPAHEIDYDDDHEVRDDAREGDIKDDDRTTEYIMGPLNDEFKKLMKTVGADVMWEGNNANVWEFEYQNHWVMMACYFDWNDMCQVVIYEDEEPRTYITAPFVLYGEPKRDAQIVKQELDNAFQRFHNGDNGDM